MNAITWIPITERLPTMKDEGWRKESDYVLVRYDNGRGPQWCRGFCQQSVDEDDGPSPPIEWRTDGENWNISGVTHFAEVDVTL